MTGLAEDFVPYNEAYETSTVRRQNLDSTLTGREVVQIATGGGHTCLCCSFACWRPFGRLRWNVSEANGRGQSGPYNRISESNKAIMVDNDVNVGQENLAEYIVAVRR